MNYSTAVMLINQNIRAVKTIYEDPKHTKQNTVLYKTLDTNIKVGDLVVVPTTTRHGMTVVLVTEVDVDVDFDSDVELKWVVSKVDTEQYNKIISEEATWIQKLMVVESRRKREELRKSVFDYYQDDSITKFPIAIMGNHTMIEKE